MALTTEEIVFGIYNSYLEDLGRIGGRHETARAFYLSVISALFVFLSLAGPTGALLRISGDVQVVVGLVGILISASWFLHMWSFGTLYQAKRETLVAAESSLPLKPFTGETDALNRMKRLRLTVVDRAVAVFFMMLFVAVLVLKAN